MMPIALKFGGYQEPASVHNRAAERFGELLEQKLGDRVAFELIGSVLKLGRGSGDLVPMVERGELSLCYMSTVRFSKAAPSLQLLELPFVVKDLPTVFRALDGEYGKEAARRIADNTQCRVLGFWDLDGPIVRITTPHVPLPSADELEDATIPSVERIVREIREKID